MDTGKGKVDHVTRFEGRPKNRERYPSRFDPKSHFAYISPSPSTIVDLPSLE